MDSNLAHILETSTTSGEKKLPKPSLQEIVIDGNLLENLSGPALITDGSFNIVQKNIYADHLVSAFQTHHPQIHGIIIGCLNNNCPENQKMTLEHETGTRHYDLFAFPVRSSGATNPQVLLFGKDTTTEQHLTKALVQSRQMFKDLVACSSDFSWETDNKGRFKYVSPNGILGYTAYELNDMVAAELIVGRDGLNPFDTLDAIHDVEIWLQRSDASFACVQVSANPIIDNNSAWQGARGVCRDITEIREREAALRHVRKNEQLLRKIISTIRDETDPAKILSTTARSVIEGINAKGCYIAKMNKNDSGSYQTELKAHSSDISHASIFDQASKSAVFICENSITSAMPAYHEEIIDEKTVITCFSKHHNEINGAMFMVLDDSERKLSKDEKSLFLGIVDHLGIALEQIKNYEKLEQLSNTDELTSLFNRRAFTEKVTKRLLIQKRKQHSCALLFIDLDNFKQVNDIYGHAVGDRVLRACAKILQKNIRTEDFCSRLGGDEFAVWLENVDAESALRQANRILEQDKELKEIATHNEQPLSLSIGIAMSHADKQQTLDELMETADKALYEVKRDGKSNAKISHQQSDPR